MKNNNFFILNYFFISLEIFSVLTRPLLKFQYLEIFFRIRLNRSNSNIYFYLKPSTIFILVSSIKLFLHHHFHLSRVIPKPSTIFILISSCICINFSYYFFLAIYFFINVFSALFFFNFIPKHFILFNFLNQFGPHSFNYYFFFNFIPHHFI